MLISGNVFWIKPTQIITLLKLKNLLSYAVEQKNLIFAQVLLNKMSWKNENTSEHFQRDLKYFSEQLVFNSPPFKKACEVYYGKPVYLHHHVDPQKFIFAIAEALTDGKTLSQKGCVLKTEKKTLQKNNQDLLWKQIFSTLYSQRVKRNLKRVQFFRHFSTFLFYKWKVEHKTLQEVQAMWVSYTQNHEKRNHNLYCDKPISKDIR